MGAKRIRRDLREAMDLGRPVLARRRLWKADHLEGFVVGVDRSWALLHLVRDVDLIGWSAVRLDTIRDVEHQDHGFLGRALALTGARPGMLDVDLSDLPPLLRSAARRVHVSDAIMKYAVDIAATSRGAGTKPVQGLSTLVRLGASPRASIALIRIGQANALMQGRDYVIPEDVKTFAHEVLRHRILLTFEALADGITSDQVVDSIVQAVPVP